MKRLLILVLILIIPSGAGAYQLCMDIPPGDGLRRLVRLCDWLREDPNINKPNMTNEECGMRLFLRGAFELNHERIVRQIRAAGRGEIQKEDDLFLADLPTPPDGVTPSPTASPTVSPTASPTVTPTP